MRSRKKTVNGIHRVTLYFEWDEEVMHHTYPLYKDGYECVYSAEMPTHKRALHTWKMIFERPSPNE